MIVHTVPVCLHMVTHRCGIMIAQGRTVVKWGDTKRSETCNRSGRIKLATHYSAPWGVRKAVMIHMANNLVRDQLFGKTMRKSYAKYDEILEMPNML